MDDFEKIISQLKEEEQSEIFLGSPKQINDLFLIPIYEVSIYGMGVMNGIQGGGIHLQPYSMVIINQEQEISVSYLKNNENHRKDEDKKGN